MSFANFVLGLMVTISAIFVIKAVIFVYSVCAYKSKTKKARARSPDPSQKMPGPVAIIDMPFPPAPASTLSFSNEYRSFVQQGLAYDQEREKKSTAMILPLDQRLSEIKLRDGQLVFIFESRDMQIKSTCPDFPPPPYSTELL